MNILELTPYIALAISILTLGTLVRNNLTSGEKGLDKRLTEVEETQGEHDRRIQAVEAEFKHLPSRDQFHSLELEMRSLSGQLEALKEQLKPIDILARRLQDIMLDKVKG